MSRERNEKAVSEREAGDHWHNLYDVQEDAAGVKVDEADGQPIDNTQEEAADETLTTIRSGSKDALPDLENEDDRAARWLRENDPDLQPK